MAIQVPLDSTGKLVETVTPLANLHRQVFVLGDSASGNIGVLKNTNPVGTEYGLPVREVTAAATSGGWSTYSVITLNSNNAAVIKNAPGQVYGVHLYPTKSAAVEFFVKLYNKASAPNPAADSALIIRRLGCNPGPPRDFIMPAGIPFSTGIGIAIVANVADNDNTSVPANVGIVEIDYV